MKIIDKDEVLSDNLANIQKKVEYLNLSKNDFIRKLFSMTIPTPPQFKAIIAMNKGREFCIGIQKRL